VSLPGRQLREYEAAEAENNLREAVARFLALDGPRRAAALILDPNLVSCYLEKALRSRFDLEDYRDPMPDLWSDASPGFDWQAWARRREAADNLARAQLAALVPVWPKPTREDCALAAEAVSRPLGTL